MKNKNISKFISSLIYIILGLALILKPGLVEDAFCYILAASAILFGVVKLISYLVTRVETRIAEDTNGFAVFHVLDRGEGIRAEDLPHLFERFYTSQSRRADAKRGIGLGLSICDAIAKAHGGSITVASRENDFTAFSVTLPL